MKIIKLLTLGYFILYSFNFCVSQEIPPIQNYSSIDYGAEKQNWNISQSEDKIIYVANNSGLLEFNGASWKLYAKPNQTIIRSVNCIENKVYTGSYMEFGYWEKNAQLGLTYTSLSEKIKDKLIEEEFWNIVNYDNFILFQSLNRIYVYNTLDNSFKIISSKSNLPKIFKVNNSIYFQVLSEGLYEIEKGNPKLISSQAVFKQSILVNIFVSFDKKIVFQTDSNGFFYLKDEVLQPWEVSMNEELSSQSVYSSTQLSDGSLVIGTISKGAYIVSKFGDKKSIINQQNGLNNNTILAVYEDADNNVWLGLDNGISVINYDSEYKVYNDIHGKLGAVYAAVVFNNKLYVGTNQGLFYKNENSNDDFTFIKGTNGQVWCLKVFDNTLFCGHNIGTFVVNDSSAELISNKMGTWDIKAIEGNPNLLLQGNYNGLFVLEKTNNKWKYRNKIQGFNISSRFFEFESNNNIIMNHEYKGIFKINIDNSYTKVVQFIQDESVPKGLKSSLVRFNNDILYTMDEGVYKYNYPLRKFAKEENLSDKLFGNEQFITGKLIEEKSSKTLWAFTQNNLIYLSQGKLDNEPKVSKIALHSSLRNSVLGFESLVRLQNQEYLIGTVSGYIILDLNKVKSNEFQVSINSIEKSDLSDRKLKLNFEDESFNYNDNNLYFNFGVTNFDKYAQVNYQYQLKGFYDKWSDWTTDTQVAFKNLPFGSFTFKVRAKIGNEISKNEATYGFTIERPWYISQKMIIVYVILLIGLFYLVHIFYKKYYTAQKQKLLEKKHQEYELSQLENEKLIMKLKNEKLQHEIESKTKELSSSTMNIIKKNELLGQIKDELLLVKDNGGLKSVLKTINSNLTKDNDWELFEEAFNNADADFLKKVKLAHAVLTPNDLRLCAYLRLNLSSKEIAPLLNISARSVEIKRYRLRKKMELSHEKSLVEYILEL